MSSSNWPRSQKNEADISRWFSRRKSASSALLWHSRWVECSQYSNHMNRCASAPATVSPAARSSPTHSCKTASALSIPTKTRSLVAMNSTEVKRMAQRTVIQLVSMRPIRKHHPTPDRLYSLRRGSSSPTITLLTSGTLTMLSIIKCRVGIRPQYTRLGKQEWAWLRFLQMDKRWVIVSIGSTICRRTRSLRVSCPLL